MWMCVGYTHLCRSCMANVCFDFFVIVYVLLRTYNGCYMYNYGLTTAVICIIYNICIIIVRYPFPSIKDAETSTYLCLTDVFFNIECTNFTWNMKNTHGLSGIRTRSLYVRSQERLPLRFHGRECYRCSFCGLSKKCVFVDFISSKKRGKFSEGAAKNFSILAQRHHVDITVLSDRFLAG
jgi:hypothetical protein